MLAKILVDQKTKGQFDEFDYKVTPGILPDLSQDQFVEVNFGGKKKLGIVSSIAKKTSDHKLKPIEKIVYPGLKICAWQKQLARFIALEYATSFSQAIFSIIPPLARTFFYSKSQSVSTAYSEGFVIKSKLDRFLYFRKIKTKKIIIFPEIIEAKIYQKYFEKNAIIFHSGLNLKKKSEIFIRSLNGDYQTIIGTYSTMFLSFCNHCLIMESYLSPMYEKDNSPKYNVLELAKKLARVRKLRIILADGTVDLLKPIPFRPTSCNIKYHLSISPQKLLATIDFIGKNLVYFPTTSGYRLIKCATCQQIIKCAKCHKILSSNGDFIPLVCNYCGETQNQSRLCPKCHSAKLIYLAPGIKTIFKRLETKKFILCDRNTTSLPPNFTNVIGTNRIFSFPMKKFDSIWAFIPNYYFHLASFRQKENIAYLVNRLKNLTKNLNIAVSSKTQIRFLREALSPNFASQELELRKKYHFPPYWNLWVLRSKNISLGLFKKIVYNLEKESSVEFIHKNFKGGQAEVYLKAPKVYQLKYDRIVPLIAEKNNEIL